MKIEVTCDHCLARFNAPAASAGKRGKCPSCGEGIRVPEAPAKPLAAASAKSSDDWLSAELELDVPQLASASRSLPNANPFLASKRPTKKTNSSAAGSTDFIKPAAVAGGGLVAAVVVAVILSFVPAEARVILAVLFWIVGLLSVIVGGLWAAQLACLESFLHGLAFLFMPFFSIYYIVTRWERTKVPVAVYFVGILSIGIAISLLAQGVPSKTSAGDLAANNPAANRRPITRPGSNLPPYMNPPTTRPLASNHLSTSRSTPPRTVPLPSFPPLGRGREIEPGVEFTSVELEVAPGDPGIEGQLYVYLPSGDHSPRSLPCIFLAPAGATSFSGMRLSDEDHPAHLPYVQAGFAVVAYEVDGHLEHPDTSTNDQYIAAYEALLACEVGGINARNAIEFALARIPAIDPARLATAGHSSAGRQALLLAAADKRIKACVAYAALIDIRSLEATTIANVRRVFPDFDTFLEKYSPIERADDIQCPVFLFHAISDDIVPYSQSQILYARLRRFGDQAKLATAGSGGHVDALATEGFPQAIDWLKQQFSPAEETHDGPSPLAARDVTGSDSVAKHLSDTEARMDAMRAEMDARHAAVRARIHDNQFPATSPSAGRSHRAGAAQHRDVWLATLAADDAELVERMRFHPGAKRLAVGTRWGIGVDVQNQRIPMRITDKAQLRFHLGEIGTRLVEQLEAGQAAGRYGNWNDSQSGNIAIGSGNLESYRTEAAALGLDAYLIVTVQDKLVGLSKRRSTELSLQAVDAASGQALWKSTALKRSAVEQGNRGALDEFITTAAEQIDRKFGLVPVPKLSPAQALARGNSVTTKESPRQALLEIRYFHAQGSLDAAQAGELLAKIMDQETAEIALSGTVDQRRATLATWLAAHDANAAP